MKDPGRQTESFGIHGGKILRGDFETQALGKVRGFGGKDLSSASRVPSKRFRIEGIEPKQDRNNYTSCGSSSYFAVASRCAKRGVLLLGPVNFAMLPEA